MNSKEITCILCPSGCRINVSYEGAVVKLCEGAGCKRGVEYASTELISPKRTLTTTVRVTGGADSVVPVRTTLPVPREKIFSCISALAGVDAAAPIHFGEIIIKNILNTGADVVAVWDVPPIAEKDGRYELA